MALKGDGAPLSLRPMSLRPGGGTSRNPFERFAKGAGANTQKTKTTESSSYEREKRKPRSEVVQYTREQLEAFQERHIQAPEELSNFPEIQINTIEPIRAQVDTRDWRGRAEVPSAAAQQSDWSSNKPSTSSSTADLSKAGERQANGDQSRGTAQTNGQLQKTPSSANIQVKMQTAEEVGRVAWTVGATKEGNDRSLREVKGILNKLTPEKFETLSRQLIQLVTNKEVLETTITLLFETAVAQPGFVTVYADLAASLSKALPDDSNFRSTLLNTCQEEFEGVTVAREKLASVPAEEQPEAERQVKLRSLGNIRFIAELFNKGIVAEKIVVICIDMLLATAKSDPKEENVELLCEMVTKAGKRLEQTVRFKPKFEAFFTSLEQLSKYKSLPVRAKFLIIDVLDLRRSSWIPRRDVLQAKKIEDIRAEAHAELGMVPPTQMPMFSALPALPQAVVGPREEIELFPAFRGGDDGWQASAKLRGTGTVDGKQHTSAFWLEEDPLAAQTQAQAPAPPATDSAPPAQAPKTKREPLKNLSDEQRESRAKSLYTDYISTQDANEAIATCEELLVSGFAPKIVAQGLARMLEDESEQHRRRIADIIVRLLKQEALSGADVWPEFQKQTTRLTDTTMDAPYAPKALAYLFAQAVSQELASLQDLETQLKDVEEVFSRRDYVSAVLKSLQETVETEKAKALSKDSGLSAEKLLKADEEIDGPGVPSVDEYLKSSGLQEFF